MTSELAMTAVSLDTSRPTASTSTLPGIITTMSTKAQRRDCLLQQEIAT
jgi:hypothetical protein